MLEIQLNVPGCAVQLLRIKPGRYTIGRGLRADIRLKHPSVARRHALLSVNRSETLVVDIGAADSIRRNGVVVSETAPARRGDTFAIGDCELKVLNSEIEEGAVLADDDLTSAIASSVRPHQVSITRTAAQAPGRSVADSGVASEMRPLQEKLQQLVLRD